MYQLFFIENFTSCGGKNYSPILNDNAIVFLENNCATLSAVRGAHSHIQNYSFNKYINRHFRPHIHGLDAILKCQFIG